MLAPKRRPSEKQRATYEMNSIITSKGNNAKGQPAGTKIAKNFKPLFKSPKIVTPNTIEKLRDSTTTN